MVSLDDIYRKFGECAYVGQLLETEIGNILLVIHHAVESDLFVLEKREEAAEIYARINKSALGQVLGKIGEITSEDMPLVFANAWAERNRLSHSFFRRNNFRRNSAGGRKVMLADLESIHGTLLVAYSVALALSGTDLNSVQGLALLTQYVN
jgi:hypothetical protein